MIDIDIDIEYRYRFIDRDRELRENEKCVNIPHNLSLVASIFVTDEL